MKYYQPGVIAWINAVCVTAVYLFIALLSLFLFKPELNTIGLVIYIGASACAVFLISWMICRYTLEKFIYSKIRLIYKFIRRTKIPKENQKPVIPDGNLLEGVSREVEKWELETNREISQLKQMETYRKEFLGNVAHELRNPIFTIQGYILTLLDGGIDDPEINREYLERTEKTVNRLITIVEDLDAITHLESGELKLNPVRFDIVALAKEVMDSFEVKAANKEVALSFKEQNPASILVKGDRERIRQVLTNLVDNAIRYRNEADASVKISFFDMDEHILTEITDNGIGINKDEIPRIFERFYRTDKGRAASKKGKGLGLSIVKHLIEAHHQTLHVRSTPGVGTTIGFTLQKAK